jgi:hypothetical protein
MLQLNALVHLHAGSAYVFDIFSLYIYIYIYLYFYAPAQRAWSISTQVVRSQQICF